MSVKSILIASVLTLSLASPLGAQSADSREAALAFAFFAPAALVQEVSPRSDGPSAAAANADRDQQQSGKKQEKGPLVFEWKDHPSLRAGKMLRIDFVAKFQADQRTSDAPIAKADTSSFDIAKRRVGIEGEVAKHVAFEVARELTTDDPWKDVYANYKQFDGVQVQGGKFKIPFSLEEDTSSTNIDFLYRSRVATQLAPGRDRGVMVHGRVFKRALQYEFGVFEHDGSNAQTKAGDRTFGDRTFAARMSSEPFRKSGSLLEDFHVGGAFTTSNVPEGYPGLRGRTALDDSFFSSKIWVNGQRRRVGFEFRWRPGPFSVKSEYIRAADQRLGESTADVNLSDLVADGWYVSGTWLLTGESRSKDVQPLRPLLQGGVGAVEAAVRIEQLKFGSAGVGDPSQSPRADNIASNSDRVLTVGVNWYLNRWFKVQANAIRETIADPSRGPLPARSNFWSRVLRLQFVL